VKDRHGIRGISESGGRKGVLFTQKDPRVEDGFAMRSARSARLWKGGRICADVKMVDCT
jgi:hypothetical protein